MRFDKRRITKHTLFLSILEQVEATKGAVSVASSAIELFPKTPLEIRTLPPVSPPAGAALS